jgi:hypothetical protein
MNAGCFGPRQETQEHGISEFAGCLLSLVNTVRHDTDPTYGSHQARLDQELILAIRQSARQGGQPIELS